MVRIAAFVLTLGFLIGPSTLQAFPPSFPETATERIPDDEFRTAVRQLLVQENLDPREIQLEIRPLRDKSAGTTGGQWRALAQVFVDEKGSQGDYVRKLIMDREYWLVPGEDRLAFKQRWLKTLWHEVHHLKFFPYNLRKARELAVLFPPVEDTPMPRWRSRWVKLQEPLEEWAAEKESLERLKAAYGTVPEALLRDSRADLRMHAERYKALLAEVLLLVQDPDAVLQIFPPELRIDSAGNIRPVNFKW